MAVRNIISICSKDNEIISSIKLLLSPSQVLVFIIRIGVHLTQLLIILFQTGQVLSGLCKLPLLHAFANVPVDERALGVHEVELVVQAGPGLSNGSGVAHHTHGPLDLAQIPAGDGGWRFVIDADLLRRV